jgi:hypothetical protein
MSDLRCESKKHGEVIDGHTVTVKCNSRFCGHVPGSVVVIHTFDISNPEAVEVKTRRFKEPGKRK